MNSRLCGGERTDHIASPEPQQMNRTHREWIGWLLVAVVAWAVFGLVLAPPFAGEGLGQAIRLGFSGVCHQIPARSPHIHDVPLAVCHRCFGVYAALAAAPFLTLGLRPWNPWMQRHAKYLLLASLIIPGVDWGGDMLGWWTNTPWSRVLTGAVFGTVAGYFLVCAMMALTGRSTAAAAASSNSTASPRRTEAEGEAGSARQTPYAATPPRKMYGPD